MASKSIASTIHAQETRNLRRRRRLQFGLPAVFGLMTLVAVTLTWRARQIEQQRSAVAALHAVHAAVFYHAEQPGLLGDCQRAWLGGQRRVEYVTFRFSQPLFLEPERLAELHPHLVQLSSLRRLKLTGTAIGDDQLPLLMPLGQLDLIDLSDTQAFRYVAQVRPRCATKPQRAQRNTQTFAACAVAANE